MHKTFVIGRLGKNPDVRYTETGTAVSNFSVASDVGYGDKKVTEWFQLVAFGKTAELTNQLLQKGSLVHIECQKQTRSWLDLWP